MRNLIILCCLGILAMIPAAAAAQTAAPVDFDAQFGGRGDGVTDNTAALNAYYAWVCAQPSVIVNHVVMRPGAVFHGPMAVGGGGRYLFTGTINAVRCPGAGLVGQPGGTVFVMHTSSPALSVGAFSTTPASFYGGGAQDYTVRDIQCVDDRNYKEGSRVASCIQDNGSGGGNIKDLRCFGVKYCFNAPYGSDLTDITREYVEYSDLGIYLGPGSQQVDIHQFHCGPVVECAVLEGASQIVFDGSPDFNACGYAGTANHGGACLTIENNTATRQGVWVCQRGGTTPCGGYTLDMSINLYAPWFESNSGGLGNQPLYFVRFQGNSPITDAVRGLFIHDAYIVSGGTTIAGSAFIGSTNAVYPRRIFLEGATLQGNQMQSWFAKASVTFNDLRILNGYSQVPLLQNGDITPLNDQTSYLSAVPTSGYWVRGTCVRNPMMALVGGKINWGFCRLTDGTKVQSNVYGTDWSAIYGTAN